MGLVGNFDSLSEGEKKSYDDLHDMSFGEEYMPEPPPDIPDDLPMFDEKSSESGEVSELEMFANEVIAQIIADKVPILPTTYEIYFQRLLEGKDDDLKAQVAKMVDLEDPTNEEKIVNLEKNVKKNVSYIKRIINNTIHLYKNTMGIKDTITRGEKILSESSLPNNASSIATLKKELMAINNNSQKFISEIKDLYKKSQTIIQEVESNNIYDDTYGIYSKQYLIKELKKELLISERQNYQSSVLFVRLHNSISKNLSSDKIKVHMSRTIAKLLHKSSKRSDIVAHYGNNLFVVLLQRTDVFGAEMTAKRLKESINANSIFVGENEYTLDIAIGVGELKHQRELKNTLDCILKALKYSDADAKKTSVTCSEDVN